MFDNFFIFFYTIKYEQKYLNISTVKKKQREYLIKKKATVTYLILCLKGTLEFSKKSYFFSNKIYNLPKYKQILTILSIFNDIIPKISFNYNFNISFLLLISNLNK